ncbi:YeiH family protein [Arcobacter porcinus]|uniref:YeiH/YadS family membrane protein n=1 Tax=Arcobacter porcinus TaxID=1935204 RepID=A0ABX2YAF0_9BACT|nr:YeiH family protein [Arcobacter porcinus]OCL81938.1 hypothetical protein AAW29_01647 [Arcobacter porcinus]OCL90354.1 hypothetical protein AAX28_01840 [Arcobacter porcinus]
MKTNNQDIKLLILGTLVIFIFSIISILIANLNIVSNFGISALIVGIILGIVFANTLNESFFEKYNQAITFSAKKLLRVGIILYGFRLSFQDIAEVGFGGVFVALFIVFSTFILGYVIGVKVLKLDKEISILCSSGASICGAAAVMATSSVVRNESYKSAIAVSFVVIFGSLAMFLLPFLYKIGLIPLDSNQIGVYLGAVLHEVANVVAAGNMINEEATNSAIIVKMIRVMFLVPFLLLLSYFLIKFASTNESKTKSKIMIPWFAIIFIFVVAFNSFEFVNKNILEKINHIDMIFLTMAMFALGLNTNIKKFKEVGLKPFYLSFILFIYLCFMGYFLVYLFV